MNIVIITYDSENTTAIVITEENKAYKQLLHGIPTQDCVNKLVTDNVSTLYVMPREDVNEEIEILRQVHNCVKVDLDYDVSLESHDIYVGTDGKAECIYSNVHCAYAPKNLKVRAACKSLLNKFYPEYADDDYEMSLSDYIAEEENNELHYTDVEE